MYYKATDLLNLTEDQIWMIQEGMHQLEVSDGVIEVSDRKIIFSHYYWRLFREFPGCAIAKRHVLTGKFESNVHQNFGALIFWDCFNNLIHRTPTIQWEMSRVFYEITNAIYNATCIRLSSYVTTASLHDIIEILHEEKIQAAKAEYRKVVEEVKYSEKPTEKAIYNVHKVTRGVLYGKGGELMHNGIKKMCIANIVSAGQMVQLIGPRGYVHDINGKVFKFPIDTGYAEGLKTLYDSAIESRSAARALFMQTDPLKKSEYFNREMQLLCSVIHSIKGESCTGYTTVPLLVSEGDLQLFKGKYHMVDGKPELIWDSIDDLVGKVIHMRTITGCGNKDTQTICKTCLGWTANVIQPETNVGYALVTILCAIISQLMLSTKHYEASQGSKSLEMTDRISKWLRMCKTDSSRLMLQKNIVRKNPIIRLDIRYVKQLNNILSVDVDELPASKITNCKTIELVEGDANGQPMGPLDEIKTTISGQGIFLSTEVLTYLKKNSWVSTPKYIEFQLKNWNPDEPIFGTPRIGDNIMLFLEEVKTFIMPTKKSETSIMTYSSRGKALSEFISLLRKRLNFNIVQVEIFVRACMTVDGNNKNYNLPHSQDSFHFMSAKHCLYNRSLTTLLAYETQAAAIIDPDWYRSMPRVTHMLDNVITV